MNLRQQLERATARIVSEQEKVKALRAELAARKQGDSETVAKLREQLKRVTARTAREQEKVKALRATLAERKKLERQRQELETKHAATVLKLREQLERANGRVANGRARVEELQAKHSAEVVGLQAQLERAIEQATIQEEQARTLRVELAERERRDRALSRVSGQRARGRPSRSADGRRSGLGLDPPIVLIASAGSGGSHLAAVLLAHRESFFTGPEANLASRPDLFDGASFDLALFKGLLRQEPYFRPVQRKDGEDFHLVPPSVLTNAASYGVDTAVAKLDLLEGVTEWPGMIRYLHRQLVDAGTINERDVLVEHSPSCAASLPEALRKIPQLRVVHLVRDPRDSIASMMARRKVAPQFASLRADESLALTAQQWAFLTTVALRVAEHPRYIRVAYEDLVKRPDEVIEELCNHFGFPNASLRADGPLLLGPMGLQRGWTTSPTAKVTERSVGRFDRDLSARQLKRLTAMRFDFPELEQKVSMEELIERFRCE